MDEWHCCRSERKRRHYTEAPETDGAENSKTKDHESGDGADTKKKKKSTEGGDNGTTSPGGADAAADGDAKMEGDKNSGKVRGVV